MSDAAPEGAGDVSHSPALETALRLSPLQRSCDCQPPSRVERDTAPTREQAGGRGWWHSAQRLAKAASILWNHATMSK
jgi:hypothetical protein